jgi:Ca-activated chloride channel family protein
LPELIVPMRILLLVLGLFFAVAMTHAEAPDAPVVLVLDSSGSMAGAMDGSPKLDAARKAIRAMANGLAEGRSLGLVAYGHRRQGDCSDIETLVPPGPLDRAGLDRALDGLLARGKTPLSDALRHAARLLPETGGTIILISDGLETCDRDPCAVAEDLLRANARLVIHVVGFGVTDEEVAALSCIAENCGGRSASADSAAGLTDALTDLGAESVPAPDPVPPPTQVPAPIPIPTPEPEPTPVPVTFAAMLGGASSPVPMDWTVSALDGTRIHQGSGRELALSLMPGDYAVTLAAANLRQATQVTVPKGPGAPIPVALEAGHLSLRLWAAQGQALDVGGLTEPPVWVVDPLDGQGAVSLPGVTDPEVLLAPGRYRIVATAGGHSAATDLVLAAGDLQALDLSLRLGTLALSVRPGEGLPPLTEGAGIEIELLGAEDAVVATAAATAAPRMVVPAGDYVARLVLGGAILDLPVRVAEGQETAAAFVVPATEVALTAALAAGVPVIVDWRDAIWTVAPGSALSALGLGPALSGQPEAAPRLRLLPGEWEVRVSSGVVERTFPLTVAPGGPQEARFDLGAARLVMEVDPATQPVPMNAVFSVFPAEAAADATPVYSGGTATLLSTIVPAGDWRVEALDEQGRSAEARLTLVPGQEAAVRLLLEP